MPRLLPFSVISRILGVLLLAAALLKLQGLALDPVSRQGIFSTPEFQMATVEVELFLAVWLLWGVRPQGAWIAALLAFLCFAGASLYLGWIGQGSCGCFGNLVPVSPWYTLAGDLAAVALLLLSRPPLKRPDATLAPVVQGWLRSVLSGLLGVVVLLGLFTALGSLLFGSPGEALAYIRGERLSIRPRWIDLGAGELGESREVPVTLVNRTDKEIRIIGGTSDCACVTTKSLPVTIPPGEKRSVSLVVNLSRRAKVL
jgi:hypothetical protein